MREDGRRERERAAGTSTSHDPASSADAGAEGAEERKGGKKEERKREIRRAGE